jgi:hypothetical protein
MEKQLCDTLRTFARKTAGQARETAYEAAPNASVVDAPRERRIG